jgi:inhibitor of cysteine peptidase
VNVLALIFLLAVNLHSPVFIESDAAQPITVKAGEEFFIALSSNPGTGYSWKQTLIDDKVVAYEGNVRQPAPQAMPGAPGQQIFVYHANRSGTATITLTYSQPWEQNAPPSKTLTFNVTVP